MRLTDPLGSVRDLKELLAAEKNRKEGKGGRHIPQSLGSADLARGR